MVLNNFYENEILLQRNGGSGNGCEKVDHKHDKGCDPQRSILLVLCGCLSNYRHIPTIPLMQSAISDRGLNLISTIILIVTWNLDCVSEEGDRHRV